MFVSDLRQVGGFLQVQPRYNWNIVESGVKHHRQKKKKKKKNKYKKKKKKKKKTPDIKIKLIHKKK
jgi:hypothetical protein